MEINGVELMQSGLAVNGLAPFTDADLQGIADAHRALGLSGRVPLKLGHNDAPDAPAYGWCKFLRVADGKLLGDFVDLPEPLHQAIKRGAFKNVSVELLRNVETKAGVAIPWVLDAVAILGATVPAFRGLESLQALALERAPTLRSESRAIFERSWAVSETELERLQRDYAALMARSHQQAIEGAIELAIASGECLPAARESFKRLFKLHSPADWARVELSDWQHFARTQPRGIRPRGPTSFGPEVGEQRSGERPDEELVRLINAEVLAQGGKLSDFEARRRAQAVVFRREPALAKRYFSIQDW